MRVNGKDEAYTALGTLTELLREKGYDEKRVAVERNGEIVPREAFETTCLSPEDIIEILTWMGGG